MRRLSKSDLAAKSGHPAHGEIISSAYAANVVPMIREVQRAGANTLREIAEALNARGINAPRRAMARHFRHERAGKRVSSTQSPFSSVGIVSVILMPSSFASRPSSANSSASV